LPYDAGGHVGHYTKLSTLKFFLPEGQNQWASAWATPVQFLNDRRELVHGLEILGKAAERGARVGVKVRSAIDQLRTAPGELATDAFSMSFSGRLDELGQWRGYASNGMGCNVVTLQESIRKIASVAGSVIYKERAQNAFASKVLSSLRNEKDAVVIGQTLVAAASFMKDPNFEVEREFRLIKFPAKSEVKFRDVVDRIVPYIECVTPAATLPILEIRLGPGWQLGRLPVDQLLQHHVYQGIVRLLDARGMLTVPVRPSEIPYDPK